MSVIILLLAASLFVALTFLGFFLWSVKHKQFDDGFSPPRRILFDDKPPATFGVTPKAATSTPATAGVNSTPAGDKFFGPTLTSEN